MQVKSELLSGIYAFAVGLMVLLASYFGLISYIKMVDGTFFDILDKFYWTMVATLVADGILLLLIGQLVRLKKLGVNRFTGQSYRVFYYFASAVWGVAFVYLLLVVIY